MSKSSFTLIRKSLAKHDCATLILLVEELYFLSDRNRGFVDARYISSELAVSAYKEVVLKSLYPDVMSHEKVSFRNANKAIIDFGKAVGLGVSFVDLIVYAVECGSEFTFDIGEMGSSFYVSLTRLFKSGVDAIHAIDDVEAVQFIDRLRIIVDKAKVENPGYCDSINALFIKAFPNKNH